MIWPAAWLAPEIPDARMLSYEYAAPVSKREGESLSLEDLVEATLAKWLAAGLGHRPLVLICHSLGGVLAKEVIMRLQSAGASQTERRLLHALRGVVFYATPHFGTTLADIGWRLRHVGVAPDPVVQKLKPGPHHDRRNDALRKEYAKGRLHVLSFGETVRTPLVSIAPWLSKDAALKMEVVPMESAFPGIGEFVVLPGINHINACKPSSREDVLFLKTLMLLRQMLADAKANGWHSHWDIDHYPQAD